MVSYLICPHVLIFIKLYLRFQSLSCLRKPPADYIASHNIALYLYIFGCRAKPSAAQAS